MILAKELALKIRKGILAGQLYKDIRKNLDIKEGTWDSWYWEDKMIPGMEQGFRTFVNSAKNERKMQAVDKNIDEFLYMDDSREDGKKDPALAKIKQDTTKFVAETLGKLDYSKHSTTDITSNGKDVQPVLVEIIREKQHGETEDTNT